MRIGGSLPFDQAGSFPISLPGGGYNYIPPGNYLITLGQQTVLQWWDPVNGNWRNLAPAGAPTFAISIDGYNYRLLNASSVVTGVSITNAGSGGVNGIGPTQTGSTVTFAAPGGNGQTAKGYVIVGGALSAPTITQAGSGFVVAPTILIDPPPLGGIQATATATISSAGVLNGVALVNPGAGYLTAPNYYVVPQFLDYPGQLALPYTVPTSPTPVAPNFPPGQIAGGAGPSGAGGALPPQGFSTGLALAFPLTGGALVTSGALTGSGTLTGLVVTDYGALYTAVPAVTFGGTSLGAAAATALMSWALTGLTGSGGVGYTIGNAWESDLGLLQGVGASYTGIFNNDVLQPRPARGRLTATTGTLIIEDPGFGFQVVLGAGNFGVLQGGSIATTSIAFSGVTMGAVVDTSILQANIND